MKPKLKLNTKKAQHHLKLAHHRHSGHLRPHEDTSYLPLALLLFAVGVVLTMSSSTLIYAGANSPPPQAESIGLTGQMPGKAPTTAATITTPTDGQHFSTSPIPVKGTCPKDSLVEVYKNDIFAGSTPCKSDGTYTVDIDLLIGKNSLIVRVYNVLNQPGPDSTAVTVYYDALPPQGSALTPLSFQSSQMLLNTDAVYRGTFPGQEMTMPIDILGGNPPYAINIQWGDSSNKVVPRNDNLTFRVSHTYKKAGIYQIDIQGTDSEGRVAFLSVAAIVNGQPDVTPVASTSTSKTSLLLLLWPLYAASIAVVISFWLGEKREKHLFESQGLILEKE